MKPEAGPGQSFPLGATGYPEGVNFSVYSKNATGVDLLLFDEVSNPQPSHTISLDSEKTGPIITGMSFCPGSGPVSSMATGSEGLLSPSMAYALMRTRFYSIPTPGVWPYPKITAAWRPPGRETLPPRP